jgi:RNA polymerase sigma-70 factor (ECF subfamily)
MEAGASAGAAERQEVFRELVERHSRMVFRLAYRITGNEPDSEEVVQEAFLKAYRNFERFDSRAAFSTWIFRIASNCAIDLLRRRKRRPESPAFGDEPVGAAAASADPSPEADALGSEIGRHLNGALALLSPQERTAFVLRHFEGQPIEQIAIVLGVRTNAAKQTIFRAVRKLRLWLEPLREAAR